MPIGRVPGRSRTGADGWSAGGSEAGSGVVDRVSRSPATVRRRHLGREFAVRAVSSPHHDRGRPNCGGLHGAASWRCARRRVNRSREGRNPFRCLSMNCLLECWNENRASEGRRRSGRARRRGARRPGRDRVRARQGITVTFWPSMHPASLRCSSVKCTRHSPSSRLAIRAPRRPEMPHLFLDGPLAREGDETFDADPETEKILLEAVVQCRRGQTSPWKDFLAEMRSRE